MAKVFYSCSFSGKAVPNTNDVEESFRKLVEEDLQNLRAQGHEVNCAVEAEGWKLGVVTPGEAVTRIVSEINASDMLVARLESEISAGVQWELGYAFGKNIPVYLLPREGVELAYWNVGLVEARLVHKIESIQEI